jgi:hypothetical protein
MLKQLLLLNSGYLVSGKVFEPCAGSGQLASGLRQASKRAGVISEVLTNDPFHRGTSDMSLDATQAYCWKKAGKVDWTVTNPPFSLLTPILKYALTYSSLGVAMILRLTALEPVIKLPKNAPLKRGDLLWIYSDNLRYIMPFSAPRPKFMKGSGHDSVTIAWFVWDKSWSWRAHGMESPFQFVTNWLK